jgi:hypothetical protein
MQNVLDSAFASFEFIATLRKLLSFLAAKIEMMFNSRNPSGGESTLESNIWPITSVGAFVAGTTLALVTILPSVALSQSEKPGIIPAVVPTAINPSSPGTGPSTLAPVAENSRPVSNPGAAPDLSGETDRHRSAANDVGYWLDQQAQVQADGARLHAHLSDLQRRIGLSHQKELGEKIRACEEFIGNVSRTRSEAGDFVDSGLIPLWEWTQHNAAEHCENFQRELAARVLEEGADLSTLSREVEAIQQETAVNAVMRSAVSKTLDNLRSVRLQQNRTEELKAVLADPIVSVSQAQPKAASPTAKKPQ